MQVESDYRLSANILAIALSFALMSLPYRNTIIGLFQRPFSWIWAIE